jgi:hypothetical protein
MTQENPQEPQKQKSLLPVIVVVGLALCAALLVLNGARPSQQDQNENGTNRQSKESDQSPDHAKQHHADNDASIEHTALTLADSTASNPPDNPDPLAQSSDTLEPELIAQTPLEEH